MYAGGARPVMSLGPAGDRGAGPAGVRRPAGLRPHRRLRHLGPVPGQRRDRAGGHQPPEQSGGLPHRGGLTKERSEGSEAVPLFPLDGADSPLVLGAAMSTRRPSRWWGRCCSPLLPWLMVLAWAWLGMDCGRQRRPFWLSLLAGHWGGAPQRAVRGMAVLAGGRRRPEHPHRPLRPVYLRRGARGDDAGHPPCASWTAPTWAACWWCGGGIASAVLLILIFTVSYWLGRRIAKAPDRPGKEVLRWKSTDGNAFSGIWSAGTPGAPC